MTTYTLVRHLVLKDLRHQRGWLILLWALAFVIPLSPALITPTAHHVADATSGGLVAGLYFLELLILIRVIQLDPPGRSASFLATRPIGWQGLLASKALFAGIFLLVPLCIVALGYTAGFQCNFLDRVLYLVESTLFGGAILAIAAILACYFRTLTQVLMTTIGGAILLIITNLIYIQYFYSSLGPPKFPTLGSEQLTHCKILVFDFALVLAAATTAFVRYRKASVVRSFIVSTAGTLLAIVLYHSWPFNLSTVFTEQPPHPAELAPELRDKISFNLWRPNGVTKPEQTQINGAGWNGYLTEHVQLGVEFRGIEPPYYVTQTGYRAEATLRSGHKISSDYNDTITHGGGMLETGGFGEDLREQIAGFTPASSSRWSIYNIDIFGYPVERVRGEDLTGVSIGGVGTFEIRRASIFRTLPLKAGLVLDLPRKRYVFTRVDFGRNSLHIEVMKKSMAVALRGDVPNWSGSDNPMSDPTWLVINRRKGEFLVPNGNSSTGDVFTYELHRPMLLNNTTGRVDVQAAMAHQKEPIPDDWADGAEICFYATATCGQMTFPYQVPAIDLVNP